MHKYIVLGCLPTRWLQKKKYEIYDDMTQVKKIIIIILKQYISKLINIELSMFKYFHFVGARCVPSDGRATDVVPANVRRKQEKRINSKDAAEYNADDSTQHSKRRQGTK